VYGTSSTNLAKSLDVSTSSATITGLTAGTYYIAVMTLNSSGVASNRSGVASVTVQ